MRYSSAIAVLCLTGGALVHGTESAGNTLVGTVAYGTYFGGSQFTQITAIAGDSQGNAYITGWTRATDLPAAPSPHLSQAFAAKISRAGVLVWSTYLGVSTAALPSAIVAGPDGSVYIAGTATPSGAFVAKLSGAGDRILYSAVLDGSPATLSLSPQGTLVVGGTTGSTNLATFNALQPEYPGGNCGSRYGISACAHGFIAGWGSADMTPLFVSYLGGTGNDYVRGSAVDAAGNIYLTGKTNSADFPLRNALQSKAGAGICGDFRGDYPSTCSDAFVAKLSPDGKTLLYATRLGGSAADSGNAIAIDAAGNMVVAGISASADFPLAHASESYPGAGSCLSASSQGAQSPCAHVFAAKLSADGSTLLYSTFVSGQSGDSLTGAMLDAGGNLFISGSTLSNGFPLTTGAVRHCNSAYNLNRGLMSTTDADGVTVGGYTGFLTELDPHGAMLFSTYFGGNASEQIVGLALDGNGGVYLADSTISSDLPVTSGAIQSQSPYYLAPLNGSGPSGGTGFLARLTFSTSTSIAPRIDNGCVVNGAGYQSGAVAPGEIVSIFGMGLGPAAGAPGVLDAQGGVASQVAGTSVTFDGAPAPLLYAGANQINAIVPFSVAGKTSTQIVATVNNVVADARTVAVVAVSPGIFTIDESGTGQAVVLNSDGTVNSSTNPAARGSMLTMWITGMGLFDKSYADGEVASSVLGHVTLPFNLNLVTPGQFPLTIQYAGQAPSMVAGVVQINARIPLNVQPSLTQVDFILQMQDVFANPVTIWLPNIGVP